MGIYDTRTSCTSCGACRPVNGEGLCRNCRHSPIPPQPPSKDLRVAPTGRTKRFRNVPEILLIQPPDILPYNEYVYIAAVRNGEVKIGYSGTSVKRRIQAQGLKLLFVLNTNEGRRVEKSLHKQYKDKHLYDEVFSLSPADLDNLKALTVVDGVPVKCIRFDLHLLVFVP
jgi:hypothetical protein